MDDVDWFGRLSWMVNNRMFIREKYNITMYSLSGNFFLEGNIHIHRLSVEAFNAIAPLYTFNPVTEKYEGKFTLLQIWEHLL